MSRAASVARIITVARELGPLAGDVVFIGGAIAPLLHTDSPLPRPRATKDVDGVIASHQYGDSNRLHDALRQRGFRHDVTAAAHVHRWIAPSGELFDLVPSGSHVGGSGNEWDVAAIESAITVTMDGVTFRHASAPAFIAMKIEAFNDRGEGDARGSHDIEDIVALIASRPPSLQKSTRRPAMFDPNCVASQRVFSKPGSQKRSYRRSSTMPRTPHPPSHPLWRR